MSCVASAIQKAFRLSLSDFAISNRADLHTGSLEPCFSLRRHCNFSVSAKSRHAAITTPSSHWNVLRNLGTQLPEFVPSRGAEVQRCVCALSRRSSRRSSKWETTGDMEPLQPKAVVGERLVQSSNDESVNLDWSRQEGTPNFPPTRIIAPGRRVVAVGDLHGDWDKTVAALQIAGVLNSSGNCWIGGATILVQLGDILDRGDDEIRIMSLLSNLHRQAETYGGAVYQVNGNHETMNAAEDFRYATDGGMQEAYEFSRFVRTEFDGDGEAAFEAWWEASRFWKPKKAPPPSNGGFGQLLSPAISWNPIEIQKRQRARLALFSPGGVLARVMGRHGVALQVNETLFAHGGILPHHVEYGLERMNKQVCRWMRGDTPDDVPFAATRGYNSVVWSRLYSQEDFASYDEVRKACVVLQLALEAAGAERLVVGHTPQMDGANAQCGGRVWRIDVGMSKGMLNAPPQVLEIIDNQVQVLSADKREDATFLHYV